jgi:hypothetical protein
MIDGPHAMRPVAGADSDLPIAGFLTYLTSARTLQISEDEMSDTRKA